MERERKSDRGIAVVTITSDVGCPRDDGIGSVGESVLWAGDSCGWRWLRDVGCRWSLPPGERQSCKSKNEQGKQASATWERGHGSRETRPDDSGRRFIHWFLLGLDPESVRVD